MVAGQARHAGVQHDGGIMWGMGSQSRQIQASLMHTQGNTWQSTTACPVLHTILVSCSQVRPVTRD